MLLVKRKNYQCTYAATLKRVAVIFYLTFLIFIFCQQSTNPYEYNFDDTLALWWSVIFIEKSHFKGYNIIMEDSKNIRVLYGTHMKDKNR